MTIKESIKEGAKKTFTKDNAVKAAKWTGKTAKEGFEWFMKELDKQRDEREGGIIFGGDSSSGSSSNKRKKKKNTRDREGGILYS